MAAITFNVWLKLVICCLRSKYKLLTSALAKSRIVAVHRVMAPQDKYTLLGERREAKGWTLALANLLAVVFC